MTGASSVNTMFYATARLQCAAAGHDWKVEPTIVRGLPGIGYQRNGFDYENGKQQEGSQQS